MFAGALRLFHPLGNAAPLLGGLLLAACDAEVADARASGDTSSNPTSSNPTEVEVEPDIEVLRALRLSEVMYHPVLEEAEFETHEFVEFHNPTTMGVSLSGTSLGGGISFTFPKRTWMEPDGYVVVAKDKAAFDALYPGAASVSFGGYSGQLGNGGDTIRLTAPSGELLDELAYDDESPWPAAPDAFGVARRWLKPELLPQEQHRHRGYSLERIHFDGNGNDPALWSSSLFPVPTPGEANSSAMPTTPPLLTAVSLLSTVSGTPLISPEDTVVVTASFAASASDSLNHVAVEWYVDVVGERDEAVVNTAMLRDPVNPQSFTATLPAQAGRSVVRYRIVGDDSVGPRVFSPREREPQEWHGYFVTLQTASTARTYDLFVEPDDWAVLWDNVQGGITKDCMPAPAWNETVDGTFAFEGELYDVQVRYQGSRYGRDDGLEEGRGSRPSRPLSVRIAFPRYHRFEGRDAIVLNKLNQGCPGLSAGLGFKLFELARLPIPELRYVGLQLNGDYYNYAQEIERPGERMIERWLQARAASGAPAEPVGDLYKAVGSHQDDGPWGIANGSLLEAFCGYSAQERYAYNYDRKTDEWADPSAVQTLIEAMHQARAQGAAATRAFADQHFDVPATLSYLAIKNWAGPWDDTFHNYFLYRSRSTKKWMLAPWDLDGQFERAETTSDLFRGAENATSSWNYFKDTILSAYRREYLARLAELNSTLLTPASVASILNEHFLTADFAEAERSPTGLSCDPEESLAKMLAWTEARHVHVANFVATAAPNAQ